LAKYETISAKIPVGMKQDAKQLGVDTNEVIRRALDYEIRRQKALKLNHDLDAITEALQRAKKDDVVADIREDRDRR